MTPKQFIPMQLPKNGVFQKPEYIKITTDLGNILYIPLPACISFTPDEEGILPGGWYVTIARNLGDFDEYESDHCKTYAVEKEEYDRLRCLFDALTACIYVTEPEI